MIHVLGSDVPHHNATVLAFFDEVLAPSLSGRPTFWVAGPPTGEHPNLDVTFLPDRWTVARRVVATAVRDRGQRFFLHGQFSPGIWLALLGGALRPEQVHWHVWGADLHEAAEGPRAALFYRMRRRAQGRVGRVSGTLGDLDTVRRRHPRTPVSPLYFPTRMPGAPARPVPRAASGELTVVVGNSGDRSNRHAAALHAVRERFGAGTRIVLPFGHPSGNGAHAAEVRAVAHRLFAPDRVTLLSARLDLDEYSELLARCDLGYFLAPRQQGIGTLSLLIRHGVPFVLSADNGFARDLTDQAVPFLVHGPGVDAAAVEDCRRRLAAVDPAALSFAPENCPPGWRRALDAEPIPATGPAAGPDAGTVAALARALRRRLPVGRFSFDFCFSLAFFLTSYLGVPLSLLLVVGFGTPMVPAGPFAAALVLPAAFYAVYRAAYAAPRPGHRAAPVLRMSRAEALGTAAALGLLATGSLAAFVARNGLLLLRIGTYGQAFSAEVRLAVLKRFTYYLLPAMLIVYFEEPGRTRWLLFLAVTAVFGALTYVAVGGTRANLVVAAALFVFLGLAEGHLPPAALLPAGAAGAVGMYLLAQARYQLDSRGLQALHNFLFLTRDTLSPWEHLALIVARRSTIEFQGLAPILRDFHVFVPRRVWPGRPDITLNTAKYFTWRVNGGERATSLSPTLIGSSYIMGGLRGVLLAAGASGLIVRGFDHLHDAAGRGADRYGDAVVKAYCVGSLFNLIVLAREGLDSFVSRFVVYSGVFGAAVGAARVAGRVRPRRAPREGA